MTSTEDGVAFVGVTLADGAAEVLRFEGAGSLARTYELGEITGRIADLEVVDQRVLHIVGADPARVVALQLESGEERVIGNLPDVPPCLPVAVTANCDASVIDRPPLATGITVDEDGNTYVADANQGALWRIDAGRDEAYQVVVSEDLAGPIGPEGGLGVQDVGIASGGHLALTVARVGDGPGAVLVQEITADGRAGARAVLYEADAEEHLGPLLVSAAGRILIGIGGAGQVALLEPDGTVVTRLPAEGALGTPTGLAFDGTAVLVSTHGARNEIVRLETGESRASRP